MAETASHPPSQADGSGSITVASYNICNGCNGGLESALRAMEAMGVDIGIFLETKITSGIYPRSSSGYSVVASNAASTHQGGIALFWRPNKSSILFPVERPTGKPTTESIEDYREMAVV